jgi:hypothetical protein
LQSDLSGLPTVAADQAKHIDAQQGHRWQVEDEPNRLKKIEAKEHSSEVRLGN